MLCNISDCNYVAATIFMLWLAVATTIAAILFVAKIFMLWLPVTNLYLWLLVIMYSHIVIAIIHQLLVFNNFVLIHNMIHSMLFSFKHWLAAWHNRIQIKWFNWQAISSWLPSYACSFRFSMYTVQNPRVATTMLICVPLTIQLISLRWNRMAYMYMWAAAIHLFR